MEGTILAYWRWHWYLAKYLGVNSWRVLSGGSSCSGKDHFSILALGIGYWALVLGKVPGVGDKTHWFSEICLLRFDLDGLIIFSYVKDDG